MSKISYKITAPIILAGTFVATMLVSIDYEKLSPISYVVLSLLFIFVFFFGVSIGQSFASPVRKILNRAIDLSHGDVKSRVYVETKDELAELARAFNEIAERLEESQCNEEMTEKSVGIKIRAKTSALEETIKALEQKVKNRTIELERTSAALQKAQTELKKKSPTSPSLPEE